ncbi:MAG: GNAT family N-acetyltransferase [Oculatellaceae cyanobacterium Prado106]|nr:GNAT family N-acetyltransferase [Oculatellaceae cyanobacterium Prado106]
MSQPSTPIIRPATPQDDRILAQHFYQLWRDNDVPETSLHPHWQANTLEFIAQARQTLHYQAFIAEVDQQIVGSAGCQLFSGLYPIALAPTHRHYGYIWGVYVEPTNRRQGLAQQLTTTTLDYLKSLGCTRAILHASPSGQPLYEKLGFTPSNDMRLDLP